MTSIPLPTRRLLRLSFFLLASAAVGAGAESDPDRTFSNSEAAAADDSSAVGDLIDRLPQMLANRLPAFEPNGAFRVYLRPHLDELFRRGYVRTPVGVRWKASDRVELNGEFQSYFSHGAKMGGDGFSSMNLGAKCEHVLPALNNGGLSLGLNFRTPLSRPPAGFTDGHRHLQPYVAATRLLVPEWGLLGYASIGANFLSHTPLASNFTRNQLHANSSALTLGAARNWHRLQISFTARLASTALLSDEGRQNISLRPEIVVPLRRPHARTQMMLTLGGHAIWGPDGRDLGTNHGFRVELNLDRDGREAHPRWRASSWN